MSTVLSRGKWCNSPNSDETQDKQHMVKDLNARHGISMLEKTWRILNLKVEAALLSHLYI